MARPGRKCRICSDPTLCAKVNALLQTGESVRAVASFANASLASVDRFAISRHKRHAFPAPEIENENLDDLQLSEKRLEGLATRLEQQYAAAIACADGKLGVDILKTLSRVEAERHHRIVDRRQAEIDNNTSDPIKSGAPSPAFLDYVKTKVHNAYNQAVETGGMVWCPMGCGRPVNPQTIPERIRLYQESHGHDSIAN